MASDQAKRDSEVRSEAQYSALRPSSYGNWKIFPFCPQRTVEVPGPMGILEEKHVVRWTARWPGSVSPSRLGRPPDYSVELLQLVLRRQCSEQYPQTGPAGIGTA